MAWCAVRKLLRKIIVKLSANSPQRAFFFRESRVQWDEESQSHKNRTEISVDSGPCLRGVRRAGVLVCRSAADRAGRAAGSETPLIQLARVDLNTAGQDALCTLPGVGEQRARAIIEYREQYGRFAAVEEAAAVPGLTEAVVAEWDGLAYVS